MTPFLNNQRIQVLGENTTMKEAIDLITQKYNTISIQEKNTFNSIKAAMLDGVIRPLRQEELEVVYKKVIEALMLRRDLEGNHDGLFFTFSGNKLGYRPLVITNKSERVSVRLVPEVLGLPKKVKVSETMRSHYVGQNAEANHVYIGFYSEGDVEIAVATIVKDSGYVSTGLYSMKSLWNEPILSSHPMALFILVAKFLDNELKQYK